MPHEPKKILWVDDEVALLRSHILFLEGKGYRVVTAPNGDDALALLKSERFDLVLLDEQMPGKRGVEVLEEIRARYASLPVVMVTKSEEEAVMDQAIGRRVADYIVKPLLPTQVLSVVKRLLEGEQIVHERTARDFVATFQGLVERRRGSLGWKEWAELYRDMVGWELRLEEGGERDLRESLIEIKKDFRRDFALFIREHYEGWVQGPRSDRPPLSPDIISERIRPLLQRGGRALLVVVDCLRLDQWEDIASLLAPHFDVRTDLYYAILPTATPYARNAIFAGLFPEEIARRYPQYWEVDTGDEGSLNRFERELLEEQLRRLRLLADGPLRYERVFTQEEGQVLVRKLPGLLQGGLVALVFNFVDILTHGRSESEILMEIAPTEAAFRSLTRSWFLHSSLFEVLQEAARARVPVILTTDHGSVHCLRPATVYAKRDASTNLRYKFGENVRAEQEIFYSVKEPPRLRLPHMGINVNFLFAVEDYYFVYPTKLREYQSRYYGSFLHGGITPEEMILPVALLQPRG